MNESNPPQTLDDIPEDTRALLAIAAGATWASREVTENGRTKLVITVSPCSVRLINGRVHVFLPNQSCAS